METFIRDNPIISVLSLYILWTAATYWLEGRLHTLLRPEATRLRTMYAFMVNIFIGIAACAWVLHVLVSSKNVEISKAGFQGLAHAVLWAVIGLVIGLGLYFASHPPLRHPMVMVNGFAQVWTVSAAEVMVCWGLVRAVSASQLEDSGKLIANLVSVLVASLLFGVYHIAHSPPFNTFNMIMKLTFVGLVTSLVFLISRDIYGTIVFHNFLALIGVLQVLHNTDNVEPYKKPLAPLLLTAAISLGLLIFVNLIWL